MYCTVCVSLSTSEILSLPQLQFNKDELMVIREDMEQTVSETQYHLSQTKLDLQV